MKIPIKWLAEYIDLTGISDEKLSDLLTMSGTENEIVRNTASFSNIVVGEIKEITRHSNADKLQVTKTDVDKENGGVLQIVCGAPNIEVGQKVPVALPGASFGEFDIKEAEIRGVKSQGMLCSESELGISNDHLGIMILDNRAKIGANLSEALNIGGTVLEAEITPNRGDCLSIIGVAREVASVLEKNVKGTNFKSPEVKTKKKIKVEILEKDLCPRYIAKVIEGVKIGPSPRWMQDRLMSAGVRPISNIVDITNYVMLEWGQPLHAFDARKIAGKIIVRKAKAGEKHITLDGVERNLCKSDLVIADTQKVIALAGVMGGLNSEVTEKTETVVLEAAVFNPTSVRKTAQRLALRSEASNRFEKEISLKLPEIAIERAAELLIETGGGKAGENTDILSRWVWTQHVGMRLSRLNKFMSLTIPEEKSVDILKSLGFEVEKFDFKKEARSHVGKPYVFGASYKTHGDMAFDCSYLTDYIYSRIGKFIGYTSLAQYELGEKVDKNDLRPGDILFIKGHINKSVTDHYFIPGKEGEYNKVSLEKPKEVGHNAIYIGNGRIVHATHFDYDEKTKKWSKIKSAKQKVVEEDAAKFLNHPEYLGSRRYIAFPDDFLAITVPWWRLDVSIEEDIFEEIGRIYGYEKLPSTLPCGALPIFEEDEERMLMGKIKQIFSGIGFSEVNNYSFISEKQLLSVGENPKKTLEIANPLSPEQEYMRTSLTPSLLSDAVINQDNYDSFKIFEIASVYKPTKDELPKEDPMLGMLIRSNRKGSAPAYFEAKGAIELLAKKLNLSEIDFREEGDAIGIPGQSAAIYIADRKIGYLEMVKEKIRDDYGIKTPVAVAEIEINKLLSYLGKVIKYQSISRFPLAIRDVNLLFSQKISAKNIKDNLSKIKIQELLKTEIIDIFESESLPEGQKSVTIRLVFGSNKKTLIDAEVLGYLKEIITTLSSSLGAKERV